jgi:hypothetical protein
MRSPGARENFLKPLPAESKRRSPFEDSRFNAAERRKGQNRYAVSLDKKANPFSLLQLTAEEVIRSEIGRITTANFQVAAGRTGSHPHGGRLVFAVFSVRTEMSKNSYSSAVWKPIT